MSVFLLTSEYKSDRFVTLSVNIHIQECMIQIYTNWLQVRSNTFVYMKFVSTKCVLNTWEETLNWQTRRSQDTSKLTPVPVWLVVWGTGSISNQLDVWRLLHNYSIIILDHVKPFLMSYISYHCQHVSVLLFKFIKTSYFHNLNYLFHRFYRSKAILVTVNLTRNFCKMNATK